MVGGRLDAQQCAAGNSAEDDGANLTPCVRDGKHNDSGDDRQRRT
jgi:hypothetical protein